MSNWFKKAGQGSMGNDHTAVRCVLECSLCSSVDIMVGLCDTEEAGRCQDLACQQSKQEDVMPAPAQVGCQFTARRLGAQPRGGSALALS
jgi:hypothetical protein